MIVEDLGSTNGILVNDQESHGRVELGPNDELMIGVTVMQFRTAQEVQSQPSAVQPVPPALAAAETPPSYGEPDRPPAPPRGVPFVPELESLRDANVKSKAQPRAAGDLRYRRPRASDLSRG